jgi:hypothetical protein
VVDPKEERDQIAKWQFHVEVLSKEIELLRSENDKLRSLAMRSLDQSIALLDRIARIDGPEDGA